MEILYFSINSNHENIYIGHLFQFVFILLLSIFIWYVLYKLFSNKQTRKAKYKNLKTLPRKWAFIIGGCIGLLIIVYVYIDNWAYFFRIDTQGKNLELYYVMPKRIVTIYSDDISELITQKTWRKTTNYRLIIKTKEGKEYISSIVGSNLFRKNMNELEQTLISNNR